MPDFSLPSGRVVDMKAEPSYGDECRTVFDGFKNAEEYHWAKLTSLCPALSRTEIEAMSREDGRALAQEVNLRFAGRTDTDEIPFENKSSSPSTDLAPNLDLPPSE